jgi:hypothetical protein
VLTIATDEGDEVAVHCFHVGQRNLSVTADVYSHVLGDETELDYAEMIT